ncbi:hypothetical protein LAZ67_21000657 [Cordylochernes scorpioides]|uniref:HTH cro/C1-type domain-containing protein n=1 Tax=Cordylochernes scorpioides TaxID=51811 RepID=A0ABY6LQR1_9ARAC|nr:hypothetical protein LAZ67_21000657 [Cordylochernes scorpioides]
MRKNKPQIPPQFQPHPKRESGTSIFGFSGTKTLVSYVPKKRKSVILISSMHHDNKCDETTGKPDIIMDYNLTKGGVDTIDQMVSNFSTSRRSRRWPLALFYALLDITALNSYIIFNYQIDKKDQKERSTFIVDLRRSLIDEHLATRNLNSLPVELQTTMKKLKNNDGSSTSRGSTMPQESDTPKSGDFDTRDKERGGRPIKFEDAELEALLDEDSSQTQEELAETLGVTQQAISNRLKVMGMVQKQGNWVPYELKPGNIERCICTCELLLKRQNRKGFFASNRDGGRKVDSLRQPKAQKIVEANAVHLVGSARSDLLELLQPNETITGERYQQQLMRLSRALKIKRPLYAKRHDKVIYQHDNARPHVAKVVKETLEALQWDVPTPPVLFTRHCSFRLPHVPFDDTWPGLAALHFLRRGEKLGRCLDRLKRRGIFSTRNPYAA